MATTFIYLPPSGGSAYWQDAVANVGALPAGQVTGEIREVLSDHSLRYWDGAAWQVLVAGPAGTYVLAPSPTTDNGVVRFDGTSGQIQNSTNVVIDDTGQLGVGTITPETKVQVDGAIASGTVGVENELALHRAIQGGVSHANWGVLALGRYSNADLAAHTRVDMKLNDSFDSSISGAAAVMTWQGNGRVGIGTTTPGGVLQLVSPDSTSITSIVRGAGSQTANLTQWQNSIGTVLTSVDSAGDITFDHINGHLFWAANAMSFYHDGASGAVQNNTGNFSLINTSASGSIAVSTNSANRILIDSAGMVGIGTNSPGAQIDCINYARFIGSAGASAGAPVSGKGVEITYDTSLNIGYLISYNRSGSAATELRIAASTTVLGTSGPIVVGGTTPATSSIMDIQSTTGALVLPRMTTTQKNALTAANGMILYDTTLNKTQVYENGAWVSCTGWGD